MHARMLAFTPMRSILSPFPSLLCMLVTPMHKHSPCLFHTCLDVRNFAPYIGCDILFLSSDLMMDSLRLVPTDLFKDNVALRPVTWNENLICTPKSPPSVVESEEDGSLQRQCVRSVRTCLSLSYSCLLLL